MAVVSAQPMFERRRSTYRNGIISHYLMWLVTCDDGHDGTAAAIQAPGLPTDGDVYIDPNTNITYMSSLEVEPRSNSDRHFEVQAQFDSLPAGTPDDNPLNQPAGYAWSYENTTETYFTDNSTSSDTNALGQTGPFIVATSAGEAFEAMPTRDKGWLTITMTRNEAGHDAASDDQYSNTVNTGGVVLDGTTYTDGVLKMSPIAATKNTKVLKSGITQVYYAKTYTFKARHEGWSDKPLDVGFNYSVGSVTKGTQNLRRILDGQGMPVTHPWPLDGKGQPKPNASDNPAVLTLKPYTAMSWASLNLS